MNTDVKITQQEEDSQTQSDLTGKVGVRLTRPEKSTTSPWATLKRLLRLG
jgi:hypothetical protein